MPYVYFLLQLPYEERQAVLENEARKNRDHKEREAMYKAQRGTVNSQNCNEIWQDSLNV